MVHPYQIYHSIRGQNNISFKKVKYSDKIKLWHSKERKTVNREDTRIHVKNQKYILQGYCTDNILL